MMKTGSIIICKSGSKTALKTPLSYKVTFDKNTCGTCTFKPECSFDKRLKGGY